MRIKGQADIEVFVEDSGYICVKQMDTVDGEKVIAFAPAYGGKVVEAIGQLREFAQAKFDRAANVEE